MSDFHNNLNHINLNKYILLVVSRYLTYHYTYLTVLGLIKNIMALLRLFFYKNMT